VSNSGGERVPQSLPKPWSQEAGHVLDELSVSAEQGMTENEIQQRRSQYGSNILQEAESEKWWTVLARQFKSLIAGLLAIAAILSFLFSEYLEGFAIVIVLAINGSIGFVTELRAIRSMEALRSLGTVTTKVRREGGVKTIPAEELVPGDIVLFEAGDIISADMRILDSSRLQADESTLTGESLPVSKEPQTIPEDTPLAERSNMLYKGTAISRGSGEAVVIATGMETELGEISSLVAAAEEEVTPLEKRLEALGRKLLWATIIVAVFVTIAGVFAGREIFLMIETGIALAVATVPEGLPIVSTIALAKGMMRMAKRNALINRLSAVETLGATTVICTDKTGTLTENEMTVTHFTSRQNEFSALQDHEKIKTYVERQPALRTALEVGVLCNNASVEEGGNETLGDPMEVALLKIALQAGIDPSRLRSSTPREREEAFDSETKMMATYHSDDSTIRVAVKGAPEEVIGSCTTYMEDDGKVRPLEEGDIEELRRRNTDLAQSGLRVLALAIKTTDDAESEPYSDLTFVGLVGLEDPPREDVADSISSCEKAGIRVVVVTGDQALTAKNVALQIGLLKDESKPVLDGSRIKRPEDSSDEEMRTILDTDIFARVTPKQKLDLIEVHQRNGSIVAMTGDGVNDAPALKEADIGVAMGQRGTQVAREAADMVLKDDAFSSIVAAVEEGRVIFDNIRKVVFFLLSCNISEIMVVGIASMANAPLPILPLQILFLNLVTDIFPALALGTGPGDPTIMSRPPRDPEEPILPRRSWIQISLFGSVITISVLVGLFLALTTLGMSDEKAVTISFLTLAFSQLWHVFNMRDPGTGFLANEVTKNRYIWGSIALCSALLFAAVYVGPLALVMNTVDPGTTGWILVFAMSSAVWIVGQIHRSRGG